MRAHRVGTNSYGIPPRRWARMTHKQKNALRQHRYRERLSEDSARLESYQEKRRERGKRPSRRETNRKWKAANREKQNRYNQEYTRRIRAKDSLTRDPANVYAMLDRAVPRYLPKDVRDDIVSDVCLRILEGKGHLNRIDQMIREALTAHNRTAGTFTHVSLDAPIPGTERMTYWDVIEGLVGDSVIHT